MSDNNSKTNVLVWFDLPVADLDRADKFYATVLATEVHRQKFGDTEFSVIHHSEGNGGCLVLKPEEVSAVGMLGYLNVEGRIQEASALVENHGGKILQPVHAIGPHGFRTVILDSEGNRIALHSSVDK
jgi:predicted enzyme related to lactoylglutathione lyase